MTREQLEKLHRDLANSGKLIEAGWISMRLACIALDAPDVQIREMRMAFFGGAQHLFASIMIALDPGDEPTDADTRRLELIDAELKAFIKDFELRHVPTEGRA
jgi:hypothetical protein